MYAIWRDHQNLHRKETVLLEDATPQRYCTVPTIGSKWDTIETDGWHLIHKCFKDQLQTCWNLSENPSKYSMHPSKFCSLLLWKTYIYKKKTNQTYIINTNTQIPFVCRVFSVKGLSPGWSVDKFGLDALLHCAALTAKVSLNETHYFHLHNITIRCVMLVSVCVCASDCLSFCK